MNKSRHPKVNNQSHSEKVLTRQTSARPTDVSMFMMLDEPFMGFRFHFMSASPHKVTQCNKELTLA